MRVVSSGRYHFVEWNRGFALQCAEFAEWIAALNDALREEVQRLKVATGQLNNSSGQNLGGQHFYHLQSQPLNSQQLQQLQQAQMGLDNQQQID